LIGNTKGDFMKVAIIGAGFSGMLAAYLLNKEGIDVTVYEKQECIGGHCRTFVSKDIYTELGTVFSFTKQIKELLIELQVDYTNNVKYNTKGNGVNILFFGGVYIIISIVISIII